MDKNEKNEEIQMKFLLIGEQAVGKSSLINQYIEGKFEENLLCAGGLDLKKKLIILMKN
jgi:GTPase SAR1 family protein